MAQDGKSDQEGEAAPPQRATEADVREAEGDAQSNARLLMPPQSVGASTAILRTRLCVGYTAAQISATLCLGRVRKDGGGKDNARPYRAAAAKEREPGVGGGILKGDGAAKQGHATHREQSQRLQQQHAANCSVGDGWRQQLGHHWHRAGVSDGLAVREGDPDRHWSASVTRDTNHLDSVHEHARHSQLLCTEAALLPAGDA